MIRGGEKKDLSTLGIYKVNIPQKFVKPGILMMFGSWFSLLWIRGCSSGCFPAVFSLENLGNLERPPFPFPGGRGGGVIPAGSGAGGQRLIPDARWELRCVYPVWDPHCSSLFPAWRFSRELLGSGSRCHIPGPAQCSCVCSSKKFPLGWGIGMQGWGTIVVVSQSPKAQGSWDCGEESGVDLAPLWGRAMIKECREAPVTLSIP